MDPVPALTKMFLLSAAAMWSSASSFLDSGASHTHFNGLLRVVSSPESGLFDSRGRCISAALNVEQQHDPTLGASNSP